MKTTQHFDGINRYSNRKAKNSIWTTAFGYLAGAICLFVFVYILFNVGNQNIEKYCLVHKGEGRLDCMFSENF